MLAVVCALADTAQAATLTWDTATGDGATITDGNGNWADLAGNWNNAGVDDNWTNATPDTAIIGGGTLGAAGTITLTTAISDDNGITFNAPNGGGGYLVTGNTLMLSGTANITVNAATATVNSALAGTVGLNKKGTGALTLGGVNTGLSSNMTVAGGGKLVLLGSNATKITDVGIATSGNSVELQNGGNTTSSTFTMNIGGTGGNNNSVLAQGIGSSTTIINGEFTLSVGGSGSGTNNSIIVTNGAAVWPKNGMYVGQFAGATSNQCILTDYPSKIQVDANNGSQFNIGTTNGANYNTMIVSNGAYMQSTKIFVGLNGASTGNYVRVTGKNGSNRSNWLLNGSGPALRWGISTNCVSNSLVIDNGGYIQVNSGGSQNQGIAHAAGCVSNSIVIGSDSWYNSTVATLWVIGADAAAGTGLPTDKPTADSNFLTIQDGGAFTNARNLMLYGTNSVVNLGNGNVTSVMQIGAASSVTTTNGVALTKADSRLNVNGGNLVVTTSGLMVSGPGTINISGPATFTPATGGNTVSSAVTGSGTLIKPASPTDALTFTNLSGFTGSITVNGGQLNIQGATHASLQTITLAANAKLNVADGTARTHAAAGLNLAGGNTLYFDYASSNFDLIAVSGAATASGSITLDLGSPSGVPNSTNTLISATSGLGGATYTLANASGGTIITNDTAIQVAYSTPSEPAWDPAGYWFGGVASLSNSMSATNWSRSNDVYAASTLTPNGRASIVFSVVTGATQQADIMLGSSMSVSNITFNDTTPVTITNDSNTLTVNGAIVVNQSATINAGVSLAGSSPSVITTAPSATLTLGGSISGNAIAKSGGGTLRLTGTNTLANPPEIKAGMLSIENGGRLTSVQLQIGAVSGDTNVTIRMAGAGSRLFISDTSHFIDIGSITSGNSMIVSNGGLVDWGPSQQGYNQSIIGDAVTANNNTVIVTDTNSYWNLHTTFLVVGNSGSENSLIISNGGHVACWRGYVGNQSGANSNSLTMYGPGSQLTFNMYNSTDFFVGNGGGSGNALNLYDGASLFQPGNCTLSGASVLNLGNGTGRIPSLIVGVSLSTSSVMNVNSGRVNGVGTSGGTVNIAGPAYFNNGGCTIGSVIAGPATNTVYKEGAGTLTLTEANTFSGTTVNDGGSLQLNNNLALQNSTFDTGGAGGGIVLNTGITAPVIGGLIGSVDLNTLLVTTNLTLNLVAGKTNVYSGNINLVGMSLAKTGPGTQVLAGLNTYTGDTLVSNGTLVLSGSASWVVNSPNITLASDGTLDVSDWSTAAALVSNQTLIASATGTNATATITLAATNGLVLSTNGLVFTAYYGGSTAPLTAGGGGGTLAMNGAPVTVNTTTPLPNGLYVLIATNGSTLVTGTPGALTITGSGLVTNKTAVVTVSAGQLVLTAMNAAPVANFIPTPASGYAPLLVTFSNTSTDGDGTITNCFWDFGDSGLGNTNVDVSAVVTHLYGSVGAYTVTLNVTNDQGAAGTTNQVINVAAVPPQPALTSNQFSVDKATGEATFHINTTNGLKYRIVYNPDLLDSNGWTNAVTPPLPDGWTNGTTGVTITIQDPSSGVTQRFYKVEVKAVDAP